MSDAYLILGSALASVLGGGGVVGVLNWWNQRRAGVRQEDRADDDSLSQRAQDLLKSQFDLLVQPLQTEVERLRVKVTNVEVQLDEQRTKYWKLVTYTRQLMHWARQHFKHGESKPIPETPPELLQDL